MVTETGARFGVRCVNVLMAMLCLAVFAPVAAAAETTFSAVEALTEAAAAPTVASDQADYAPGSTVTLSGSGWQPGEAVRVTVNDDLGQSWARSVDVTADAEGRIADTFTLPDWFVAAYAVVATGTSGSATTSFTDAALSAAAAPAGVSYSLTVQAFTSGSCLTPVGGDKGSPVTETVTAGTLRSIRFGSAEFVKLTAGAATAPAGASFASWSGPGSFSSNSEAICVATPVGGTELVYTATYTGGTPAGPANQTITFDAPAGATYGDANLDPGATASSGLPVSYTTATPGTCAIAGVLVQLLAAGTCTVTAAQAGNASFNPAPAVTGSFLIAAKTLTGSFTTQPKTYDGTAAAAIAERAISGVVGADAVSLTGGSVAFADENVGIGKPVSGTGFAIAGAAAANYVLASATIGSTGTIAPAAVAVAFTAADKVYDGTVAATISGRSLSGVLAGDSVTVGGGTATFADASAGVDKTVTLTGASLAGIDAGNYVLSSEAVTAPATIARLGVEGSFTAASKSYDGTAAAEILTRTLSGVLDGDDVALTGGTAAFEDANAGPAKAVVLSGAALVGADGDNYALTGVGAASATIAKRLLTVTGPSPAPIVYGDPLPSLSPGYDGFVAGEGASTLALAPTCTPTPAYGGAGSYTVRCDGGEDGNYAFAYAEGALTVLTKPLTGAISAANKVYDGTTAASTTPNPLDGLIGADTLELVVSEAWFVDRNAGPDKLVTAALALSGADARNYHLTAATATALASILQLELTVKGAQANARDYDGTTGATVDFAAATLVAPIAGDDVTLDSSAYAASFASKEAGADKPVTLSGVALAGADAGNYTVEQPVGLSAEIRRLAISGSFTTPASKIYDGGTAATVLTRALLGVMSGDAVLLSGGSAAFDTKDAGSGKTVTLTGAALTGADAPNYSLAGVGTQRADILQAPLAVTAQDKQMILNDALPALTWSITGYVPGESFGPSSGVTGAPDCTTSTGTAPGSFEITCTVGTLSAENYTFGFVEGKLTVSYSLATCLGSAGHAILQPIDRDGSSVFKQGSTVPAKFRVCDARGVSIAAPGVVASFRLASTSLGVGGPVDEAVASTTPDTAFRWSATDQQWIYNINTKSLAANRTYNYEIVLDDDSKIAFRFGLR